MMTADLIRRRLANQHLGSHRFRQPQEVVAWLGAMQAQEYAMAKWAIGLRLPGATDASVESSFNAGELLRTHVLRPTWHFVAPGDLRWLLRLTAPRVHVANAYMYRQLELDPAVFKRSHSLLEKALGAAPLTRAGLQAAYRRAKIAAEGHRLAYLLMEAELEGLICSGPREGRQFTYALLDERVPPTKPLSRDEALAELTRRYFASRGPATVKDFAWWSGLTLTEAKAGGATLGADFAHESLDGQVYVFPSSAAAPHRPPLATFLMPDYDEYGISYKDRRALFASSSDADELAKDAVAYNRMIVIDGLIAGSWRRTETRGVVTIEAVLFKRPSSAARRVLAEAAQHYGAFIGKKAELQLASAWP